MKKIIIPILLLMVSCSKEREPYYQFTTTSTYTVDNITAQDSTILIQRGFPLKMDSVFTKVLSTDVEAVSISNQIQSKQEAKHSIWNEKQVYNTGDYVYYQGKTYVCLQWNSNKNPKVSMYNFQTVNYWMEGKEIVTKSTKFIKK